MSSPRTESTFTHRLTSKLFPTLRRRILTLAIAMTIAMTAVLVKLLDKDFSSGHVASGVADLVEFVPPLALILLAWATQAPAYILASIRQTNELHAAISQQRRQLIQDISDGRPVSEKLPVELSDWWGEDEFGAHARTMYDDAQTERRLTIRAFQGQSQGEAVSNIAHRTTVLIQDAKSGIAEVVRDRDLPNPVRWQVTRVDKVLHQLEWENNRIRVACGQPIPRRVSRAQTVETLLRAAVQDSIQDPTERRVDVIVPDQAQSIMIAPEAFFEIVHLLTELLNNALEFTDPRQDLSVRLQCVAADERLKISIDDSGKGFDSDEQLERCRAKLSITQRATTFDPNYTGLDNVGRIAANLGIEVRLDSSPRGGAMAEMILPAALLGPASASAVVGGGDRAWG